MRKEDILNKLSVFDIYGDNLKPQPNGKYKMKCPLPDHEEKTPSFIINKDLSCHCFGCGFHGSAYDFVMKRDGVDFNTARKYLADKAGISTDQPGKEKHHRLYCINKDAQKFFANNLSRNEAVKKYLIESRGLTEDTIQKFGIGCTNGVSGVSLVKYLRDAGYTDAEIHAAGLACKKDNNLTDLFVNRVMIPIFDKGRVVAFGGRAINDPDGKYAKYINSYESPIFQKKSVLFGFNAYAVKEKGALNLVEGYFDVITCHQAGHHNVAAVMGTALSRDNIAKIRKECGSGIQVNTLFDGDASGSRAAQRSVKLLFENYVSGQVVILPEGKDPDSWLRGGNDFYRLFEGAQPYTVYLSKNFPEMRKFLYNELLKRGNPLAIVDHLSYMATPEDVEMCRQMNVRHHLEGRLKKCPVIAEENGIEVRKYHDDLFLLSKGHILIVDEHEGNNGVVDHAKDMIKKVAILKQKSRR